LSSWVSYHFKHLRRWREYAEKVSKAAKDLLGEVDVYVIGGVAENRTTIYSDIDVLIVVKGEKLGDERKKLRIEILERAMDKYGLPVGAPIELHIINEKQVKEYMSLTKKAIKINTNNTPKHKTQ